MVGTPTSQALRNVIRKRRTFIRLGDNEHDLQLAKMTVRKHILDDPAQAGRETLLSSANLITAKRLGGMATANPFPPPFAIDVVNVEFAYPIFQVGWIDVP